MFETPPFRLAVWSWTCYVYFSAAAFPTWVMDLDISHSVNALQVPRAPVFCLCMPIARFLQPTRILSLCIRYWILEFCPLSPSFLLSLSDVLPCVQYCSKCLQPVVILPHLRFKSDLSPSPGNSIYKVCLSVFLLASFTGTNFCRNFIIAFTDFIHPPLRSTRCPATHNSAGLGSQCWSLDFCSVPGSQTSNSDGSFFSFDITVVWSRPRWLPSSITWFSFINWTCIYCMPAICQVIGSQNVCRRQIWSINNFNKLRASW